MAPAFGQERTVGDAGTLAQAPASFRFDIPAKPLPQAIADFSAVTNLRVLYTLDQPYRIVAKPIAGTYTADQALQLLLAGTGLTYRFTNAGTVTILGSTAAAPPPPPGTVTLSPVTVEAEGETAHGPVKGYVARRSATGSKTDTPLLENPQSISVVTRDQMDAQGAQSVSQALRYTPGISTDLRPASRYDIIPLRGFGSLQSFVQFQDGLKLQRAISYGVPTIDAYNLERIEILRGPPSVLYGQGNLGGFVNLVSKRPTTAPFNEVELQFGNEGRIQGAFDSSGPLGDGKTLFYRFTALGRSTGTQIDDVGEQRVFVAPALTWRPTPDTTLTFLASYLNDPKSSYTVFLPSSGTLTPNPNGRVSRNFNVGDPSYDRFTRAQAAVGYQFEHHFSDVWTVRQNFRYMHLNTHFMALSPIAVLADGHTFRRSKSNAKDDLDSVALDNQIQAKLDTGPLRHTVLLGLDYQYSRAGRLLGSSNVGVPNIDYLNPAYNLGIAEASFTSDTRQRKSQVGVYLQDQIKFGNLNVVLGLRHDWADSTTDTIALATNAKSVAKERATALTWRAGAVYTFDFGLAPYFSYATSFEPVSGVGYLGAPFKPSKGKQYEVGLKFQPKGFNSFVTLAFFHLTQTNVLTPDPDVTHLCGAARCSVQTGEVRSRGVELEAKASLTDNLDLIGSYTYLDVEVTKSNSTDLGKRPAGVPEHAAALWGYYTFREGPLAGFGLGAGVRYVGETFADAINTVKVPSYTLVDAAAHYEVGNHIQSLKGLRVSVNVTNLLDKNYFASCSAAGSLAIGCFYGLRRSVYATLRYRW